MQNRRWVTDPSVVRSLVKLLILRWMLYQLILGRLLERLWSLAQIFVILFLIRVEINDVLRVKIIFLRSLVQEAIVHRLDVLISDRI